MKMKFTKENPCSTKTLENFPNIFTSPLYNYYSPFLYMFLENLSKLESFVRILSLVPLGLKLEN